MKDNIAKQIIIRKSTSNDAKAIANVIISAQKSNYVNFLSEKVMAKYNDKGHLQEKIKKVMSQDFNSADKLHYVAEIDNLVVGQMDATISSYKKHYADMDEDRKRKAANIVRLRKD